ncbi:HAD-IIIC family phosphatase [Comamonas terrigena]|uniref:HAD-IIIC family phosphatase n=1 Tax=Comamonas terrigena TaxID=32013 RepID=UPI00289BFC73|nr:HAD-IIIC family phosphatase [Comamonas terrigena]
MKRIVMDLDETICTTVNGDYANSIPKMDVIERIRDFKAQGFEIVISTSRNMRTYEGNVGKINANTLPIIVAWLDKNNVPYDEIYTGKPWCGTYGFYVDDRALRPDEFVQLSVESIRKLVGIKG